jgi:hypothetical protein
MNQSVFPSLFPLLVLQPKAQKFRQDNPVGVGVKLKQRHTGEYLYASVWYCDHHHLKVTVPVTGAFTMPV